jgi:glycine/D-amino acid oxidase-like deaminating enzyme
MIRKTSEICAMASSGPIKTATRIVRRDGAATRQIGADICVVGAGIAGTSAALEAARFGRKVALVDGLHALGGQAVNSVIGRSAACPPTATPVTAHPRDRGRDPARSRGRAPSRTATAGRPTRPS